MLLLPRCQVDIIAIGVGERAHFGRLAGIAVHFDIVHRQTREGFDPLLEL